MALARVPALDLAVVIIHLNLILQHLLAKNKTFFISPRDAPLALYFYSKATIVIFFKVETKIHTEIHRIKWNFNFHVPAQKTTKRNLVLYLIC